MESEAKEDDVRKESSNVMERPQQETVPAPTSDLIQQPDTTPYDEAENEKEVEDENSDHNDGSDNDEDDDNDDDGDDDDNDDSSDDSQPVQSLLQGRERRSTQGNRYASLIQQEAVDDDEQLNEIFQEGGDEDTDFDDSSDDSNKDKEEEEEEDDDDSSSDEEDQGPAAEDGDLAGEKQLQKEERAAKRVEKRKADRAFTKIPTHRKRVKIDESATPDSSRAEPDKPERKRKMSERLSWLPTDPPARMSSRTLSIQNKERTMASMKESEEKRMKQIAVMEAAQKRKAASKARPMTQAERMAEAARTEELNSKSLSRWEEMEEEKARKQAARLEAMHNRKIDGPFIRWYSAKAEWVNGKLKTHGKNTVTETVHIHEEEDETQTPAEPKKKPGRKPRLLKEAIANNQNSQSAQDAPTTKGVDTETPIAPDTPTSSNKNEESSIAVGEKDAAKPENDETTNEAEAEAASAEKDMQSVEDGDGDSVLPHESPASEAEQHPTPDDTVESFGQQTPIEAATTTDPEADPALTVDADPQDTTMVETDEVADEAATTKQTEAQSTADQPEPQPKDDSIAEPEPIEVIEHTARNTITLENFEETAVSDPTIRRSVVFGTPLPTNFVPSAPVTLRSLRPPKIIQPVCIVTKQPAKYRDPATGLPYSSLSAYKAIRKVVEGNCVWSDLLGAWSGGSKTAANGGAAKGVPDGFFTGVVIDRAGRLGEVDVKAENVT